MKKILMPIMMVILIGTITVTLSAYDNDTLKMLETVGVLSGQGLYLTYTSIGAVMDAWSYDAYTDQEAMDMLYEFVAICETVVDQFDILLDSDIMNAEDVDYVSQLSGAYTLLIKQGEAGIDFIDMGTETYIDKFEENRITAWDKIAYLLGLE